MRLDIHMRVRFGYALWSYAFGVYAFGVYAFGVYAFGNMLDSQLSLCYIILLELRIFCEMLLYLCNGYLF